MPNFFTGVAIAFLEPILHGWCNIIDNYFSNEVFPNLSVLLFFGTVLNLIFLPAVLFFDPPKAFSPSLLIPIVLIGAINVIYLFPYYWALRHADTSIVASLFSLGKIFVPVLAFFVIGEQLATLQYVGFGIIVLSATLLTLNLKELKLNKAFFLMLGVSLVLSTQAILYKFVFEAGANWGSVVGVLTFVEITIAGVIMLLVNRMDAIANGFHQIRANLKLFGLQQGLEWGGNVSSSYAVSALPVTVAQSISSTQPLFVLAYALMFGKRFGEYFKELTDRKELIRKGILFTFMIIGTALVVAYGADIGI